MKETIYILVAIVTVVFLVFGIKLGINAYKANQAIKGGKPGGGSNTILTISPIGRTAYANSDSVLVLNSDFSIDKVFSKDQLIGKVDSIQGASYRIGDKTVLIGDVYLK